MAAAGVVQVKAGLGWAALPPLPSHERAPQRTPRQATEAARQLRRRQPLQAEKTLLPATYH